jgi:transposase-like protein
MPAVRAAIQRSQASLATLSRELVINPKTVAKWRKRMTVSELSPVRPAERPLRPSPSTRHIRRSDAGSSCRT